MSSARATGSPRPFVADRSDGHSVWGEGRRLCVVYDAHDRLEGPTTGGLAGLGRAAAGGGVMGSRIEGADAYTRLWGHDAVFAEVARTLPRGLADTELATVGAAFQRLCSRVAADGDHCRACWGVVSPIGHGHIAVARASATALNPAREETEVFAQVACGAPLEGGRWARCDADLRAVQEALDGLAPPSRMWHYPNAPNLYADDLGAYQWGAHYPRLQAIKRRLDPAARLAFTAGVQLPHTENTSEPQPQHPSRSTGTTADHDGACASS